MKKKPTKKTYFLLLLMVLVWSFTGYRIWNVNSEYNESAPLGTSQNFAPKKTIEKKKFSLLPIAKDPFLGTVRKKKVTTSTKASKKTSVAWPQISYQGMIEDGKGTTKVFIIAINGQQHIFSPLDAINDVQLIRGTSEKVTLRYQGEQKEFTL